MESDPAACASGFFLCVVDAGFLGKNCVAGACGGAGCARGKVFSDGVVVMVGSCLGECEGAIWLVMT